MKDETERLAMGKAEEAWEASDDAKLFVEDELRAVQCEIVNLIDGLQSEDATIAHLKDPERLAEMISAKPYYTYEYNGEKRFAAVKCYFMWRNIYNCLQSYCFNGIALAKSFGNFDAARYFIRAKSYIDVCKEQGEYFLNPISYDEADEVMDNLRKGEEELMVSLIYRNHKTMEEVRKELEECH